MTTQIDDAATVAIPALAIATTMVGITFWPFALTAVFSICALVYQEKMPVNKSFLNVIASTAIGGMVSQLSAVPVLLAVINFYLFNRVGKNGTRANGCINCDCDWFSGPLY